jgi:hypothetical protein
MSKYCKWVEDEEGYYETKCGHYFVINDGTPSENDMVFCCYCGKKIKERNYVEKRMIIERKKK